MNFRELKTHLLLRDAFLDNLSSPVKNKCRFLVGNRLADANMSGKFSERFCPHKYIRNDGIATRFRCRV